MTRVRLPSPALPGESEQYNGTGETERIKEETTRVRRLVAAAFPAATPSHQAAVAQLVERVLGKDEVMGPNPISSSLLSVRGAQRAVECY